MTETGKILYISLNHFFNQSFFYSAFFSNILSFDLLELQISQISLHFPIYLYREKVSHTSTTTNQLSSRYEKKKNSRARYHLSRNAISQ